jgi:2-polyprenyl-6-hydroxyphenyl methylase/3-demethylubiquinone-9 3-methyltransferase
MIEANLRPQANVELLTPERYLRDWLSVRAEIAEGPHGDFFRVWIPGWLTRETAPRVEELFALMDQVWDEDPPSTEQQFASYYSHPVWWLNAKLEEFHRISIEHRIAAVKLAARYAPKKALDRGGGYGLLVRMAHDALPEAQLELEDVASSEAISAQLNGLERVRVVTKPDPPYDVIWSIEVFEHLPDPLREAYDLNRLLRRGGVLITSYSFYPMIKCHLPRNFYLRHIFHRLLPFLGYKLVGFKQAGVRVWVFRKERDCSPLRARIVKLATSCLRPLLLVGNAIYPIVRRS